MADINIKISLGATEAKTLATEATTLATDAKTQIRSLNSWKQMTADAVLPLTQYSNSIRLYRKATNDGKRRLLQRLLVYIPKEIIDFPITFELWRYTRGKVRYSKKGDDGKNVTTIRDRRIGWTRLRGVNLKVTPYRDDKDIHNYYDIRLEGIPANEYKDLVDVFNGKIQYVSRDSNNIGEDMEVYNNLHSYKRINFFTGKYYKGREDFCVKYGTSYITKNNKLGIKVYIGTGANIVEIAFLPFSIVRQYSEKTTDGGKYLVPNFYIGRWS